MIVGRLRKEKEKGLYQSIINKGVLIATKRDGKKVVYKEITTPEEIVKVGRRGDDSPAKFVFPQTSTLFKFKLEKGGFKIIPEDKVFPERVIFGVAPCDAQAISILDKVFLEGDFIDQGYKRLRESITIVGIVCNSPLPYCFCTSVGLSPFDQQGMDISTVETDDFIYFKGITDKGIGFLETHSEIIEEVDQNQFEEVYRDVSHSLEMPKVRFDLGKGVEACDRRFQSRVWEKVARICISCGICVYMCPTCQCFDIQDESKGFEGRRFRVWDSCQFPSYTLEASGENPRGQRAKRVRNRVLHKFNYMVKTLGQVGCVGCGRCEEFCPESISIENIIENLIEEVSANE